MKQTVIEFVDFLRHPQHSFRSSHKVRIFILFWALMSVLNVILLALTLIYGHLGLDLPEKAVWHRKENTFWITLLFVPFIEEMACRLYLIPNKRNILLSSIVLVWGMYKMVVTVPDSPVKYAITRCLISLPIGFLLSLALNRILPKIKYAYLFYFSALLFGAMHFHAFIYESVRFFSILYVLFYIIVTSLGGIMLGYIRVSLGIVYSVLFHFSINFLPVMAAYGKL